MQLYIRHASPHAASILASEPLRWAACRASLPPTLRDQCGHADADVQLARDVDLRHGHTIAALQLGDRGLQGVAVLSLIELEDLVVKGRRLAQRTLQSCPSSRCSRLLAREQYGQCAAESASARAVDDAHFEKMAMRFSSTVD